MPVFTVIQQTFPDGSHRWKFFTYGQQVGQKLPPSGLCDESDSSANLPGWTIARKEIENARRAKQTVYELARSNIHRWQWFVTLTFNPAFVRRQDYFHCLEQVRILTTSLTRRGCCWLFVPEHHADGKSYHFHGLVGGDMLLEYGGKFGPPGRERDTYHIPWFPGFTSVQPVSDASRVCTYITKYITKDLVHLVPKGSHRYLYSRNLLRPETTYLNLTREEFCALVNRGEYFEPDRFEEGLSHARYVKKVPIYYTLNKECMYIVED